MGGQAYFVRRFTWIHGSLVDSTRHVQHAVTGGDRGLQRYSGGSSVFFNGLVSRCQPPRLETQGATMKVAPESSTINGT